MKALVLGTSNSVMREGWLSLTREMAANKGLYYDNQSIGALPSLYLAYRLQDMRLMNGVDRVVIDFCINDQIHMGSGIYDIDRAEGHYMAAFRQLSQSQMLSKTLVLLFTQERFALSGEPCPIIERLKLLCARFGIRTLDAKALISQAAKARGEGIGHAYKDAMHFALPYQKVIGEEVVRRLRQKPNRIIGPRVWANRRALRKIPFACIRSLKLEPTTVHRIENVGTSLARRDVVSLPQDSHATISGGRWLLGLFHWTHPNAGAFCLKSRDEERRFHLRRVWLKRLFVFDALQAPFPLSPASEGSGATLHVANPRDVPYHILIGQRSSIYDCTDATVDLVDLIGSDLSPQELAERVAECHALCEASLLSRLGRALRNRLLPRKT
jgi:hypothetical protein